MFCCQNVLSELVNREPHQWLNQQLNFICALVRHRMCNFSHFIATSIRFQPNAAFRLKISNVLHCASTKANIWTALKRHSECDTSYNVVGLPLLQLSTVTSSLYSVHCTYAHIVRARIHFHGIHGYVKCCKCWKYRCFICYTHDTIIIWRN